MIIIISNSMYVRNKVLTVSCAGIVSISISSLGLPLKFTWVVPTISAWMHSFRLMRSLRLGHPTHKTSNAFPRGGNIRRSFTHRSGFISLFGCVHLFSDVLTWCSGHRCKGLVRCTLNRPLVPQACARVQMESTLMPAHQFVVDCARKYRSRHFICMKHGVRLRCTALCSDTKRTWAQRDKPNHFQTISRTSCTHPSITHATTRPWIRPQPHTLSPAPARQAKPGTCPPPGPVFHLLLYLFPSSIFQFHFSSYSYSTLSLTPN